MLLNCDPIFCAYGTELSSTYPIKTSFLKIDDFIISLNLSIPNAKPVAGKFLPPKLSINPSYLPPPIIAFCAPSSEEVNSKTRPL